MTGQQNISIQTKPQKTTETAAVFVPVLLLRLKTFCLRIEKLNNYISLDASNTQTLNGLLHFEMSVIAPQLAHACSW